MNPDKNQQNRNMNHKDQDLQNKTNNIRAKEAASPQEDGFRYDYDDSSDFEQ
ncbi:hypothetical protein [Mesobacillus harenae]|uniref:hypothetical protein n=1 Tax=Mesobacillus harenae TaxID=2213203 RepID=UPI001580ED19|nr:hypothetical protein [Mesobacillus harenae]